MADVKAGPKAGAKKAPATVRAKTAPVKPVLAKAAAAKMAETPIPAIVKPVAPEAKPAPVVAAPVVKAEPTPLPAAPVVQVAAKVEPEIVELKAPVAKAEKLFVPEPAPQMAQTVTVTKTAPEAAPINAEGLNIMNDTVKQVQETAQKFAADATAKVEALFGDAATSTKTAFEKSTKIAEDAVAFQKDNLDAVVASSKLAAAGVEKAAQHAAELGRKHFEDASAALKAAAAAKSPTDFFTVQNDFVKSSYEAMVAETSKSSEATMKFFGEVFQPISSRFALAAEKVKAASAL